MPVSITNIWTGLCEEICLHVIASCKCHLAFGLDFILLISFQNCRFRRLFSNNPPQHVRLADCHNHRLFARPRPLLWCTSESL
uniref:Uncharacterized protein n=1 Tax=Physcomitrium patens TaxID=3218 RepID=A0A2K1IER8_PHYPA|nr:hypothetical protein PHYPA_029915 [Physcomitrium patens]